MADEQPDLPEDRAPEDRAPEDRAPDLDALLGALRDRVERRRIDGMYPPGLESDLEEHFRRLTGNRPPTAAFLLSEIDDAVNDLAHFAYQREVISAESRLPGGTTLHRAIAKGVGRQIQGVLDQTQDQSQRVVRTIA
ncbi:MAG TPA: hypothetical protein VL119_01100, partial [Acidimicrobiia bacterium]|nr:hypothetical protein [Acidimicrobiia bacterium]